VSSEKIYEMFLDYLQQDDFVGAIWLESFYKWDIHAITQIIIKSGRKYKHNPKKKALKS